VFFYFYFSLSSRNCCTFTMSGFCFFDFGFLAGIGDRLAMVCTKRRLGMGSTAWLWLLLG
jgi:hypothetical protein